jgi:hypothetical protein
MTRLIRAQCVQNLLRRDNLESSLCNQRFEVNIGSRFGTEILIISGSIEHNIQRVGEPPEKPREMGKGGG